MSECNTVPVTIVKFSTGVDSNAALVRKQGVNSYSNLLTLHISASTSWLHCLTKPETILGEWFF